MAVRIQTKNDKPTEEDLKRLKKYTEDAEKDGFKVVYSNDPNAVLTLSSTYGQKLTEPDLQTLLSLSDHLRKTIMTIRRLGRASDDEIASQTQKARAVESAYLN